MTAHHVGKPMELDVAGFPAVIEYISHLLVALALPTGLPYARDWLNGVPSSALGLHLQDQGVLLLSAVLAWGPTSQYPLHLPRMLWLR